MTVAGVTTPTYCTNPIAFAAPLDVGPPLLIDQATSATAFVTLRRYAEAGEALQPGWAIDAEGRETTDARAALRGALLAFGGARGANVALMVEVLAAGLTGANWSLDAPPFDRGDRSPGAGLLVVAIAPRLIAPDFPKRLRLQLERLASLGVHIPGRRGGSGEIELADELIVEIERRDWVLKRRRGLHRNNRGSWCEDSRTFDLNASQLAFGAARGSPEQSMADRWNRRRLLTMIARLPFAGGLLQAATTSALAAGSSTRVRPGDPAWPSEASWDELRRDVGGRLVKAHRRWPPVSALRTRLAPLSSRN